MSKYTYTQVPVLSELTREPDGRSTIRVTLDGVSGTLSFPRPPSGDPNAPDAKRISEAVINFIVNYQQMMLEAVQAFGSGEHEQDAEEHL